MIGIYRIRNTSNGKVYIGQSVNIEQRWRQHLYELRHDSHHSPHLQYAYNQDPDSLVFEVVCQCDECDLNEIEIALIKKYNSDNPKFGYNIEHGGNGTGKMSEETKRKLSESKKGNTAMVGKKLTDEWKTHLSEAQPHKRKIICIETEAVYDSAFDASRKTEILRTNIVQCCTGHKKSAGGYHWRYFNE